MKAWNITGVREIMLEDRGAAPVPDDSVKIKMLKGALDTPDSLVFKGQAGAIPVVPGRQGMGIVSETGKNAVRFKRGDRVYAGPLSACGDCAACKAGRLRECAALGQYGIDRDGLLCDFAVLPQRDLYLLPNKVTDSESVFIERAAAGISVLDRLNTEKGEYVVIMGANATGILLAQLALYYQAVPILVDVRRDRLDIAEKLGVYYTVDAVSSDPLKKVFSITCGQMAESMVYALPCSLPLSRAFECVMPGGRAVVTGFAGSGEALSVNLAPLIDRQIAVSFVAAGVENIPTAINTFASGGIESDPLVTETIRFSEVDKFLADNADDPFKNIYTLVDIDRL
ncbi:MAG: alcohol dehydrogenase catalytic domain-containing protein [Clostridiales bacterium]|jgi:threonine dehydrogenase-like Zn-dependent dehydrogenase|nr:alcohol dehydrogenase catalytic domain-containing protein [Clostridiales bacterium]